MACWSSCCDDVADGPRPSDYKTARQASGILLFAIVAVIVLLDAFRTDFEVNPLVLVPLILGGAALLSVDVPGLGRK